MTLFRGVSVLLDQQPPERGTLAHGREWSERLRLPLRTAPLWTASEFFRPFELSIFDGTLPAPQRHALLTRSLHAPLSALLACPPSWRPLSRVLILNQNARPGEGFLDAAADLCRSFQAAPVVLTVGRTEAEAKARERAVEEAFARRRLAVDCDFMAGCDAATAVARAARWRRCSHVFLERPGFSPWWRRLFRDIMAELSALSDALTLVAVPGTPLPSGAGAAADAPHDRPREQTAIIRP